jgi:hypothetical protein
VLCTQERADQARCGICAAPAAGGAVGPIGPVPAHTAADPDLKPMQLVVPVAVHPKPLVPARDAREIEVPSAARSVRKLAESHGWEVRTKYALGWVMGARGETRSLMHKVSLRMQYGVTMGPDTRMVVALWGVAEPELGFVAGWDTHRDEDPVMVPTDGWKFEFAYGWGAGQPHHKLSAVALKATIKEAS